MPQLLRDMLHHIFEAQPDVTSIAAYGDESLLALVDQQAPDVVVLALSDDQTVHLELLRRHPALRVVVLEDQGRLGSLYELSPCRLALGELTPESLVRVIRAVRDGCAPGVAERWAACPARTEPPRAGGTA
jgi:DNA-binding NarL/FixJ family response regulator